MSISSINNTIHTTTPPSQTSGLEQFNATMQEATTITALNPGEIWTGPGRPNIELGSPSSYLAGVAVRGTKVYLVTNDQFDLSQATFFGSVPTGQKLAGMPLSVVGTYNPHIDGTHLERMQLGLGVAQSIVVPSIAQGGTPVTIGGSFANIRTDAVTIAELAEMLPGISTGEFTESDFAPGGEYADAVARLTPRDGQMIRLTVGIALSIPGLISAVADPATAAKLAVIQKNVSPNVAVSWNFVGEVVNGEVQVSYNGRNIPIAEFIGLLSEDVGNAPLRFADMLVGQYIEPIDTQSWLSGMQNDFENNLPNFGNPTVAQINNNHALNEGMANIWHLSKPSVSNGRNHGDPVLAFANTV